MVHPCDGMMSKWLEFFRKLAGKPAGKTVLLAAVILTLALVAAVLYRGGQRAEETQTGLKIIDDNVDLYIRDVHFTEVAVHIRVVDDFPDEENALLGENPARGVGEIDRAFHPITETELFGQQQGGVADGDFAATVAQFFDDGRMEMDGHLGGHQFHDVRAADIDPGALRFSGCFAHLRVI